MREQKTSLFLDIVVVTSGFLANINFLSSFLREEDPYFCSKDILQFSLSQQFSIRGDFASHGTFISVWRHFCHSGNATGMQQVEANDAAEHSTVPSTTPCNTELSRRVSRSKVEKPWSKLGRIISFHQPAIGIRISADLAQWDFYNVFLLRK